MVVAKLVSKAKQKKSLRIHDEKGLVIFLFSALFDLLTLACVSTQEELHCETHNFIRCSLHGVSFHSSDFKRRKLQCLAQRVYLIHCEIFLSFDIALLLFCAGMSRDFDGDITLNDVYEAPDAQEG